MVSAHPALATTGSGSADHATRNSSACGFFFTTWSESDLIVTLLEEEPERWTYINIPAVSEHGISDALERAAGTAMTSALGRTAAEFSDIRSSVGVRTWRALLQGVPSPPAGGLVQRAWLTRWRLPAVPENPVLTVIGVDPSDSGKGDSCGLVAASLTTDGTVVVHRDHSRPMTSEAWARAAVELAFDTGASEIAIEGFSARETYTRVVSDVLRRTRPDRHIRVSSWPPAGSGRGKGDAVARSSALLQGLEVGTCRIAGELPSLEQAAVRTCPDW